MGEPMNHWRRTLWHSAVLLALAVTLTGCGQYWKKRQAHHDVRELKRGLEYYLQEQGQYPRGTVAEMCALLRGGSVAGQNQRKLAYIEAKPREINAAGEFVDPWGHPYHIAPGSIPPVYSNGPNGIDEKGAGDDITK
jgi:hypothetical protein